MQTNIERQTMRIIMLWICLFLGVTSIQAQGYEELISKSYDYLEKKDLPAAEESLKAAMRLEPANPNNFALLTNLGTIQRRQGKLEEAMISYSAALSGHPQNQGILESRASLYAEMGDTEMALNDYSTLLALDPTNEEALYNRGLIYLQQKNYLSAEQDFEKILEVNDKSVRGRVGYAILEKMRGNFDESERIYNYLISELPKDWSLYEGRADLYFMKGKNARAMSDINKVFAETTPTAALYVLRGKVKLALYEKPSAAIDFKKAQEMGYDPETIRELIKLCK